MSVQNVANAPIGSYPVRVSKVEGEFDQVQTVTSGLEIPYYDFLSVAYPDATTETYTFKTGGASGTTSAIVTVVYTDSTKENLSSVTKV
jgi:hypothetical protein